MIQSHVIILLVFSVLVAAVFAVLQRDTLKAQLRFGLMALGAFILSTFVIGWLMHPFPR
jgi:hypothetical protein